MADSQVGSTIVCDGCAHGLHLMHNQYVEFQDCICPYCVLVPDEDVMFLKNIHSQE